MENAEEIFQFLEDFSKRKPKTIPQELNDYLAYVARTGDPVYQWSLVKSLFKEKLLNVITDFYETSPGIDIPLYPNVDPFNYDTLKNSLIERLDSFTSAPFTVQRICELLTFPRKQYNRVDKYMRAIEKNILVVSTREPGTHRHADAENGEPIVNGSDNISEYNVDVEMEDMSWKDTKEPPQTTEPQPSSSEAFSISEIETRLQAKQEFPSATEEKPADTPALAPSDQNTDKEKGSDQKLSNFTSEAIPSTSDDSPKVEATNETEKTEKMETDIKMESEETISRSITIPEIKINDTSIDDKEKTDKGDVKIEKQEVSESKSEPEKSEPMESIEESSPKEMETDVESKLITEVSETSSSSEESSSSSDNTDGNSNSPKAVTDDQIDDKELNKTEVTKPEPTAEPVSEVGEKSPPPTVMQSDNYSITDVNSELPQIPVIKESEPQESVEGKAETTPADEGKDSEEQKTETETEAEKKHDTNDTATPV